MVENSHRRWGRHIITMSNIRWMIMNFLFCYCCCCNYWRCRCVCVCVLNAHNEIMQLFLSFAFRFPCATNCVLLWLPRLEGTFLSFLFELSTIRINSIFSNKHAAKLSKYAIPARAMALLSIFDMKNRRLFFVSFSVADKGNEAKHNKKSQKTLEIWTLTKRSEGINRKQSRWSSYACVRCYCRDWMLYLSMWCLLTFSLVREDHEWISQSICVYPIALTSMELS